MVRGTPNTPKIKKKKVEKVTAAEQSVDLVSAKTFAVVRINNETQLPQ